MNDDAFLRLVAVVSIAAVALLGALFLRRGGSARRYRIGFDDLGPGLYLFTSVTCVTCVRMRDRLAGRADVIEITYEGGRFPESVRRVPALAHVDEGGDGWIAYGVLSDRQVRRWLGNGP